MPGQLVNHPVRPPRRPLAWLEAEIEPGRTDRLPKFEDWLDRFDGAAGTPERIGLINIMFDHLWWNDDSRKFAERAHFLIDEILAPAQTLGQDDKRRGQLYALTTPALDALFKHYLVKDGRGSPGHNRRWWRLAGNDKSLATILNALADEAGGYSASTKDIVELAEREQRTLAAQDFLKEVCFTVRQTTGPSFKQERLKTLRMPLYRALLACNLSFELVAHFWEDLETLPALRTLLEEKYCRPWEEALQDERLSIDEESGTTLSRSGLIALAYITIEYQQKVCDDHRRRHTQKRLLKNYLSAMRYHAGRVAESNKFSPDELTSTAKQALDAKQACLEAGLSEADLAAAVEKDRKPE